MDKCQAHAARHARLLAMLKPLPTDYASFGGQVERWEDEALAYPDCSYDCKWAQWLWDEIYEHADSDWLVCARPDGPRAGLLTFEHQAGFGCFERRDPEAE
jgi:hypothetical protein